MRKLLKHIISLLDKPDWEFENLGVKRYYVRASRNFFALTKNLVSFFHHHNATVQGDNDRIRDIEKEASTLMVTSLEKAVNSCNTRLPDAGNGRISTAHLKQARLQLLDAAMYHFKNVREIKKVYDSLFGRVVCAESISRIVRLRAVEATLQSSSSSGGRNSIQDYALFTLWARFGYPGEPVDNFEFANSLTVTKPHCPEALAVRMLHRYAYSDVKGKYVVSTESFAVDPTSASTLDMINRALTIAHRGVRKLLIRVVEGFCLNPRVASHNAKVLVTALRGHRGFPLVLEAGGQSFQVFQETRHADSSRTILFKEWCTRNRMRENNESLKVFIKSDPHWADPREVGEFLNNLVDQYNGASLLLSAANLIRIRDAASHNMNLTNPIQADNAARSIGNLRSLMEEIGIKFNVRVDNLIEYSAILEIQNAFPHFKRWSNRQRIAFTHFDAKRIKASAQGSVQHILRCLCSDGTGSLNEAAGTAIRATFPVPSLFEAISNGSDMALTGVLSLIVANPALGTVTAGTQMEVPQFVRIIDVVGGDNVSTSSPDVCSSPDPPSICYMPCADCGQCNEYSKFSCAKCNGRICTTCYDDHVEKQKLPHVLTQVEA